MIALYMKKDELENKSEQNLADVARTLYDLIVSEDDISMI